MIYLSIDVLFLPLYPFSPSLPNIPRQLSVVICSYRNPEQVVIISCQFRIIEHAFQTPKAQAWPR